PTAPPPPPHTPLPYKPPDYKHSKKNSRHSKQKAYPLQKSTKQPSNAKHSQPHKKQLDITLFQGNIKPSQQHNIYLK
ncbi:hypothetical protein, partial [Pseudomonas sp. NCIMB 10586]|uniref:hypothetical protein n=1 Tax=Pseudomonas sp. NCIMB 10586 TaxID=2558872 RepID=UPI002003C58E